MPRSSKSSAATLGPAASARNQTVLEKNSTEDLETVDFTDAELLAALGYTPTHEQINSDFKVYRVPVLTDDAGNEAAAAAVVFPGAMRNGGDTGWTFQIGVPTTGLIADTKFIRVRMVTA